MAVTHGNVIFRGEGLNNLVLTCSEDRKVYRLMKKNTLVLDAKTDTPTERAEKIKKILENHVSYVQNVIKPQISSQFIAEHNIVTLPEGFAETIESDIANGRPEFRPKVGNQNHNTNTIDPATKTAVMLPDLCFVTDIEHNQCLSDDAADRPTISVEIKPKKGFMPSMGNLPEESAIKYSVCKFCIHQRLKAKEGRWTKTSHYCPIDLYSGNRDRMKHALYALCETPQNNLKICVNGDEVYGKHVRHDLNKILKEFFGVKSMNNGCNKTLVLSEFLDLVLDALLHVPLQSNDCSPGPDCCCSHTKTNVNGHLSSHQVHQKCSHSSYTSYSEESSCLPRCCVLGQILAVQALDQLDIESVYPLFIKIKDHLKGHPHDKQKWNLYGPFTEESWLRPCVDPIMDDTGSLEYAVDMVKRHNVSKTLQDCSLMVALQRLDSSEDYKSSCLTDAHGRKYKFSVSVIDLDYKPFNKVRKWHDLELEMLKAYKERETSQPSVSHNKERETSQPSVSHNKERETSQPSVSHNKERETSQPSVSH